MEHPSVVVVYCFIVAARIAKQCYNNTDLMHEYCHAVRQGETVTCLSRLWSCGCPAFVPVDLLCNLLA